MVAVIIAWIAYCFLFVRFIFNGFRIGDFITTVLIVAVLFILLVLWTLHKLTEPAKRRIRAAAPAAAPAADDSGTIIFRVAGTTFDNEDGTSRQDLLRGFRSQDPEDLDVTFEETDHADEQAIAVLVNDQQVGFVPKSRIPQVTEARKHVATCYVSGVRIIGGGTDPEGNPLAFGCEITLEY